MKAAFALRRKTLCNSLASVFPLDKEALTGVIAASGLPPAVRGEALGLEDFSRLADALYAALGEP